MSVEHTDTYLVRVGRDTIKPGTVAYFAGGHAMMVFRIMPDGKALVIQGHPGEKNGIPPSYFTVASINETTLPQDFYYKSGGFRNWRPYVKSATTTFPQPGIGANGANGPVVTYKGNDGWTFATNASLSDLDRDLSQFQQSYTLPGGKTGNFYQYLSSQLCSPSQCGKRKPTELREILLGICNTIKERQTRVESATKAGLTKAAHPGVPNNVYETSDPWESQSTPGFDARIRSEFGRAVKYMRDTTNGLGTATDFEFQGTRADLLNVYQGYLNEAMGLASCQAAVEGETGKFALNIKDVNEKVYDMSFDPYHCPELRWGIKANCSAERSKFYNEEVRVRNVANNGNRPAAGAVGENGANGLPIQLERGPAQPPALGDRNIQEAINQLRSGSSTPTTTVTQPTTQPAPVPVAPVPVVSAFPRTCKATGVDSNVGVAQIYAEPKATASYETFMSVGDQASVLGESGNWYKVRYNGITGYLSKNFMTNCK